MSKLRRTFFPLITMKKLLTASLLLAGLVQPALAQQTAPAPSKALAAEPANQPAQVPDWVAAEFSEAYGRYFPDLPAFYRYTVSQKLRNTALADPKGNMTSTLAQYAALREGVYQTIYQYCHALKYGVGDSQEVDKLVYSMLYNDFHLSDLAATRLAPYISSRYQLPVPPAQYCAYPAGIEGKDELASGQAGRLATHTSPRTLYTPRSPSPNLTGSSGLEMSGWRFESTPLVEATDDNPGVVRFRIKITDQGEVESVTKVAGNVSSAQEKLCRDKLLDTNFIRTNPGQGGTTGYYTFRFTVR